MRRHDLTAQHLAILSLAGRHQGDGMPRFTRGRDQCQRLRTWQVPRQDTEFGIRTIQAKRTVTAMNRHVLQLYRPAYSRRSPGSSSPRMKTSRTILYTNGEWTPCPRK